MARSPDVVSAQACRAASWASWTREAEAELGVDVGEVGLAPCAARRKALWRRPCWPNPHPRGAPRHARSGSAMPSRSRVVCVHRGRAARRRSPPRWTSRRPQSRRRQNRPRPWNFEPRRRMPRIRLGRSGSAPGLCAGGCRPPRRRAGPLRGDCRRRRPGPREFRGDPQRLEALRRPRCTQERHGRPARLVSDRPQRSQRGHASSAPSPGSSLTSPRWHRPPCVEPRRDHRVPGPRGDECAVELRCPVKATDVGPGGLSRF